MKNNETEIIGQVYSSELNSIIVRIDDLKKIEKVKDLLGIGSLLSIKNGNFDNVIAIVQNVKMVDLTDSVTCKLDLYCQPIGCLSDDIFERGVKKIPMPCEPAFFINNELLKNIFEKNEEYSFVVGSLVQNPEIKAMINGDNFFSKHVAVVGSTGSGKSCVVSKLLQQAVGIDNSVNKNKEQQKIHIL